jgi:hypothetical protein
MPRPTDSAQIGLRPRSYAAAAVPRRFEILTRQRPSPVSAVLATDFGGALGTQFFACKRQPTTLGRGERNPLFAHGGPEDLLQNPILFHRIRSLIADAIMAMRN